MSVTQFSLDLTPRFCETDALGHINNTVIPVWFEAAREPIFEIVNPGQDLTKWNIFYTFMLGAVQFYLSNDLKKMKESETSIQKRISDKFTSEFYEWFIDRKVEEFIKLSNLYGEFLTQSEFSEKDYSKNRFSKALESSCKFFNSKLERMKEPVTKNMMVRWNLEGIK